MGARERLNRAGKCFVSNLIKVISVMNDTISASLICATIAGQLLDIPTYE